MLFIVKLTGEFVYISPHYPGSYVNQSIWNEEGPRTAVFFSDRHDFFSRCFSRVDRSVQSSPS